ncbi:MAG: hypothetical protein KDJ17_12050 [Hyphomicrobiaceae bacterium]|nr:hypothetical protein [Hyphomicrobiaceae bacterium]
MSAHYRVTFNAANNEDLQQGFALTDQDGVPISLAQTQLRMALADLSGTERLEASTQNGHVVITSESGGQFELLIPASQMATLPEGIYRHDMILTTASATRRIWTGTLALVEGVTQ